jgi:putative hydrolase of the HAD superfamily
MIKAVLFDLGDTVFIPDWDAIDEAMRSEAGISIKMGPETKRFYQEKVLVGTGTMLETMDMLITQADSAINPVKALSLYKHFYHINSKIDANMINLISALRSSVKVYALSNTNQTHKEVNEDRGIFKNFDRVFLSCDMALRKPDPRIYTEILKSIRISPESLVFIDDSKENIETATRLGIICIHYKAYDTLLIDLVRLGLI